MGKNKLMKKAKKSMKILKSGKLMLCGNQKLDLSSFVDTSADKAVVSRLDGIISKESTVIEDGAKHCDINVMIQSQMNIAEIDSHTKVLPQPETIVITIPKKAGISAFDFLNGGILGDILRSSTLASVYKKVKKEWVELNNDDNTQFTNVMYLPNIMVFLDPVTGVLKKTNYYVNLLILAVPSQSKMIPNTVEEISQDEAIMRIIGDILETGIRVGAKNLIIDPFSVKTLKKNKSLTSELWGTAITSNRIQEQYDSIEFSTEKENDYIVFKGNAMKDVN